MLRKFYLILFLSWLGFTAYAYDFENDGIYYNVISVHDLSCEVTYQKSGEYWWSSPYAGDIVIPSTVSYNEKTFTVTSIGEHSFDKCYELTSVVIPNSVTSIGFAAFFGCNGLTSVTIPNSVTTILDYAFQDCSGLTSVIIPNSVTSIGDCSFLSCSGLLSVIIPNSITSIGSWAFGRCSGLTSVIIPNTITSIDLGTFSGCSSLTSIIIPESVTSIGQSAFSECTSMKSVEIGNNVTEIKLQAFSDCTGLTSIVIGNSVTSIGTEAFKNCDNLQEIKSLNVTPPNISANTFEGVPKMEAIVKVPDESVTSYQTANYWKAFWNIVGLNEGGGDPEKCTEPTIELENGKLVVKSDTEGSECYTSITSEDFKNVNGNEPISLTGIYNITTYAHAEGYLDSETVSAILVWVNPELQSDGIISMEAKKSILLRTNDDAIIISGLEYGEWITLYNITGVLLESVKATGQELRISNGLQKGQIYIVKVGDKNVKIKL